MTRTTLTPRQRARGFTMTEVLVALFVLSIGLLGVAALQLTSLKSNHASAMRSQATFLAYDIIDRMRANRTAALAGAYETKEGASGAAGSVAGDDVVAWKGAISRTLPGVDQNDDSKIDAATGSVTQVGNIFRVSIVWGDAASDDPKDAAKAGQRQLVRFLMETQLNN